MTLRSVGAAACLFFLAPLVAEYLLGDIPLSNMGAMVALAPMYGGGAILIRETVRRTGRGWPTFTLLALAYAVMEEGLVSTTRSIRIISASACSPTAIFRRSAQLSPG